MSFAIMSNYATSGTISYTSGSLVMGGGFYDEFAKFYCRYCGQNITNKSGTYFSKDLCEQCDKKLADEFWKTKIPKTSEYCQVCYSHIKACKCPKAESLRKLKQ